MIESYKKYFIVSYFLIVVDLLSGYLKIVSRNLAFSPELESSANGVSP